MTRGGGVPRVIEIEPAYRGYSFVSVCRRSERDAGTSYECQHSLAHGPEHVTVVRLRGKAAAAARRALPRRQGGQDA